MSDPSAMSKGEAVAERFKRLSDNFDERCRKIEEVKLHLWLFLMLTYTISTFQNKEKSRLLVAEINEVKTSTPAAAIISKMRMDLATKNHELGSMWHLYTIIALNSIFRNNEKAQSRS